MWRRLFLRFGLNDEKLLLLERYLSLLHSAGDANVTSIKDKSEIVDVLLCSSLVLLDLPEVVNAGNAVDIGSGAGIPGIPLAIARPSLDLTLIDSSRKKCGFMLRAIRELGLKNATVLWMRAEDAASSYMRDSFDLSMARAVAQLAASTEYSLPLARPGGFALLMRGKREPGDEEKAQLAAQALNGSVERIALVNPYDQARNMHVWLIKKEGPTPARFPRKPGMAKKRPLA